MYDLYAWVKKGGYNFIGYSEPEDRIALSLKLRISEKLLFNRLCKINIPVEQSIGEIVFGNMHKQSIYVSKQQNSEASLEASRNLIFANGSPLGFRNIINDNRNYRQLRNETFIFMSQNIEIRDEGTFRASHKIRPFQLNIERFIGITKTRYLSLVYITTTGIFASFSFI